MRALSGIFLALFVAFAPASALAQEAQRTPNVHILTDPRAFVTGVSTDMARRGVAPLREAYGTIYGSPELPQDIENLLAAYERIVGTKPALVHRIVEDMVLSDTVRSIYSYHYFGENAWLFVRYDFVRTSDREWAFTSLAFSSEWSYVARVTTPGFRSIR